MDTYEIPKWSEYSIYTLAIMHLAYMSLIPALGFQRTPALTIQLNTTMQGQETLWCKPRQSMRSEGEKPAQIIMLRLQCNDAEQKFSH